MTIADHAEHVMLREIFHGKPPKAVLKRKKKRYMQRVIELITLIEYQTPVKLKDMGLGYCYRCGHLICIDNLWCKQCESDSMIIYK